MALQYRQQTMDQMWSILEGDAAFTNLIKSARRIKDTESGWFKRMVFTGPADFPHLSIEVGDNFTMRPFPIATFAAERAEFGITTDDWLEPAECEFKLRFLYSKAGFAAQDELEMTAFTALRGEGRSLGLDFIRSWGPIRGRRNLSSTLEIGAQRTRVEAVITQIVIPVQYEFEGRALLPS